MRQIAAMAVAAVAGAALLSAQGRPQPNFTFTKVDLKLLDECDALDRQFEKRALVYHDPVMEKRLAEIAAPLLPRAPLDRVEWRFHILRDPMVNAFALPNGSVYIDTGLLARAENDDQVAGVLAHEATHVINRHSFLFNRSVRKKVVAAEVIAVTASWVPAGSWGAAVTLAANTGEFIIVDMVYGYSRELEEDADRVGMERLEGTGRSPAQLVRMFELLDEKLDPEPVPRFFWSHPRIKDRIAYLKEMIGADKLAPPHTDPAYLAWTRPALLLNIPLDLDSRRFRSALAAAERLAAAQPEDPEALYWVGESYRELGPRQPRLTKEESTDAGLRKGYKQAQNRTEVEDEKALAAMPEGRAALEANQRKAEEFLRKAAALDASRAEPHFALGALYQQEGRKEQAIESYRNCIALAKQPGERQRAERRIEELTK